MRTIMGVAMLIGMAVVIIIVMGVARITVMVVVMISGMIVGMMLLTGVGTRVVMVVVMEAVMIRVTRVVMKVRWDEHCQGTV